MRPDPTFMAVALLTTGLMGNPVWAQRVADAGAASWPSIVLPANVTVLDIGQPMVVNGKLIKTQAFVSATGPAQLADWFRLSLGKPLMENQVGAAQIFGVVKDNYLVTVHLEAAGTGTRGVAAVTDMKAANDRRAQTLGESRKWLSQMPAGTRMLSQVESRDGDRVSLVVMMTNNLDESVNQERVVNLLSDEGLSLERQSSGDGQSSQSGANSGPFAAGTQSGATNSRTLYFKGTGSEAEAIATLSRDESRKTIIVVNSIRRVGGLK